jgi:hypothetical protein
MTYFGTGHLFLNQGEVNGKYFGAGFITFFKKSQKISYGEIDQDELE